MPTAILVSDLSRDYGTVHAVRGVSFAVQAGEIFGLLGPNGAGKTTTLECIMGLRRPGRGSIRLADIDALAQPAKARALLGAQLQTTALHDKITPRQALRLFASFYAQPEDVDTLLGQFDLFEVAHRPFDSLSGGFRQRLGLALALVNRPQIVLLDEPTAGLDAQVRRQTHEAILRLRAAGKTILLTTHYMEEAHRLCDRVAIIHQGVIAAIGAPDQLVAQSQTPPRLLVRTARPMEQARLLGLAGVTSARQAQDAWQLSTTALPRTLTALIHALETDSNTLVDLRIHQPTLEDVFLEWTGARLGEGEE
jgi:ABC-2 type transport system ATP-binding protein